MNTRENDELFDQYLREICRSPNTCPVGRLGLYKYLDMDKAVSVSFDMMEVVEDYRGLRPEERYARIKRIRERY